VLFYCMDPRFYEKIEIFEIQNFNKIPSFTILFYISRIFGILFCISPIQTCSKIMEFFVVFFIGRVRDFTNDFWKILKVLLKKILICEIFFSFKILWFTICFLFFLLFLTFYFSIWSICTCQKILEIFMFFYLMD